MFLYFLLHITAFWADFLLILHGISLLTWARGADSSSQVKKIRVFAVLHWKLFFNWCNPNNLCLSDISWRHLDLTWRHLNLWKGEPLSCSSNSQQGFFLTTLVFQTEPDWHYNSVAALMQDTYGHLLKRVIVPPLPRFAWQCSKSDWANWKLIFFFAILVFSQISPWSDSLPGCANAGVMMQNWPRVEGAMGITPSVTGCAQSRLRWLYNYSWITAYCFDKQKEGRMWYYDVNWPWSCATFSQNMGNA